MIKRGQIFEKLSQKKSIGNFWKIKVSITGASISALIKYHKVFCSTGLSFVIKPKISRITMESNIIEIDIPIIVKMN